MLGGGGLSINVRIGKPLNPKWVALGAYTGVTVYDVEGALHKMKMDSGKYEWLRDGEFVILTTTAQCE